MIGLNGPGCARCVARCASAQWSAAASAVHLVSGLMSNSIISAGDSGRRLRHLPVMPDRDSAERFADNRLAHVDRVGIDVQVVSHGANSPAGRRALSLLRTRPRLARGGWHPRPAAELLGSTGSSPEPEAPQRSLG